jgi:hypothetical protein
MFLLHKCRVSQVSVLCCGCVALEERESVEEVQLTFLLLITKEDCVRSDVNAHLFHGLNFGIIKALTGESRDACKLLTRLAAQRMKKIEQGAQQGDRGFKLRLKQPWHSEGNELAFTRHEERMRQANASSELLQNSSRGSPHTCRRGNSTAVGMSHVLAMKQKPQIFKNLPLAELQFLRRLLLEA